VQPTPAQQLVEINAYLGVNLNYIITSTLFDNPDELQLTYFFLLTI